MLLHLVRLLLQVVDALDEQLHLLLEEGVGVELEPRKVRRRRREADLVLELEEEGRREVRVAHLERELLEDLRPRRRRRRRVARKLPLLVLGHERVGEPEGAQREAGGARARRVVDEEHRALDVALPSRREGREATARSRARRGAVRGQCGRGATADGAGAARAPGS